MLYPKILEQLNLRGYNVIAGNMLSAIFIMRARKMSKLKQVNNITMGGFPQRDTKFVQRFFADYNPIRDIQIISNCLMNLEDYLKIYHKSDKERAQIISYLNEVSVQLEQLINSYK